MKKFFKFLFILISIAAIAGCVYFGYFYFKDYFKKPTETMSFSTAKELVYTASYDLGYISEATYQLDLGKAPLEKASNASRYCSYGVDFEDFGSFEYVPYTNDNVGLITFEYSDLPFESMGADSCLEIITLFFNKNNISENKYYNAQGGTWDRTYTYSYKLASSTELIVYAYSSDGPEHVFKYVITGSNNAGITDYNLTIYTINDGHTQPASYYNNASIINLEFKTKNNVKKLERYSYVFGAITTSDINDGFSNAFVLDVDIKNSKMLVAETIEMTSGDSTIASIHNKLKDCVTRNTHANRKSFYSNITIED